jgi:hypothetical protein
MCEYMGYEFGAGSYPDSVCIDGYLWDADSGSGDGLTVGGEKPCPECNHESWLQYGLDSVEEEGAIAAAHKMPRESPYSNSEKKLRYEADRPTLIAAWLKGYDSEKSNQLLEQQ